MRRLSASTNRLRFSATFEAAVQLLDIPGVARQTAEVIVSEIGTDMSRFPSANHLAAWAGLAPGNHESAGKRLSGKTRYGNQVLGGTGASRSCSDSHQDLSSSPVLASTRRRGKSERQWQSPIPFW